MERADEMPAVRCRRALRLAATILALAVSAALLPGCDVLAKVWTVGPSPACPGSTRWACSWTSSVCVCMSMSNTNGARNAIVTYVCAADKQTAATVAATQLVQPSPTTKMVCHVASATGNLGPDADQPRLRPPNNGEGGGGSCACGEGGAGGRRGRRLFGRRRGRGCGASRGRRRLLRRCRGGRHRRYRGRWWLWPSASLRLRRRGRAVSIAIRPFPNPSAHFPAPSPSSTNLPAPPANSRERFPALRDPSPASRTGPLPPADPLCLPPPVPCLPSDPLLPPATGPLPPADPRCLPAPVRCLPPIPAASRPPVPCLPSLPCCLPAPVPCLPAPVPCLPSIPCCLPAPVPCLPAPVHRLRQPGHLRPHVKRRQRAPGGPDDVGAEVRRARARTPPRGRAVHPRAPNVNVTRLGSER